VEVDLLLSSFEGGIDDMGSLMLSSPLTPLDEHGTGKENSDQRVTRRQTEFLIYVLLPVRGTGARIDLGEDKV
jgi:hypothetical protein